MTHISVSLLDPVGAVTLVGLAMLALVPLGAVWMLLDRRTIGRERVALKPTKFALSIAVYLLTIGWMLTYVRPERLGSGLIRLIVWGLLVSVALEFLCIAAQAVRGRRSHFNRATPLDGAISVGMGVLTVPFVGLLLPLAWEIAARPRVDATPVMVAAIIAGLVLTLVLGALTGVGMARNSLALAEAAARGARMTPDERRRTGLRLRLAHFCGIHALQAIPLIAAVAARFAGQAAAPLLVAGTVGYTAVTLALLFPRVFPRAWPVLNTVRATTRWWRGATRSS
ncbi:hypothetical protein [Sphingomonas sp. CARO-RG-8B-R24-01]|uniref:hypothetical protein n=1 Tax=Sphingomonas sp. CARO-RG-8B-R24-01 TaxID=2914831 RepID=UPI001F579A53|nr:hypothetical protein [Sphingomonas sp. CARO-RG-8B-R24-01]